MDSFKNNSYSMNRILSLKESITITMGTVISVGYLGSNVVFTTLCTFIASIIPSLLYTEMWSAIPYVGGTYNYVSKWLVERWVIPSDFDKIHPKYKTPYFSIIFLGIITIALIYIGDILYVASSSLFADLFYYIIGFFAFIGLRKKHPDLKREYKSPCGILLSVFSIVVYAIVMTELEKILL